MSKLTLEIELPDSVDYSEDQLVKLAYLESQNLLHTLIEIHKTMHNIQLNPRDKVRETKYMLDNLNIRIEKAYLT